MPFAELTQVRRTKRIRKDAPRGCEACPLNKIEGINKIMGTIRGKRILVVGQSPGMTENRAGHEFVGDSGEFLWVEMDAVGLHREDCDIFNVVRCVPADLIEGTYFSRLKMRSPTPEEIHCCSVHTENTLPKVKAKHILILGQIAQKAFLETRSVPQQKIFWSEKHQAKIYLADHPSFFIRGYGAGARIEAFRSTLKQLAIDASDGDYAERADDNFSYLREQRYLLISTAKRAAWAANIIKAYAAKGRRISVDVEYDIFDGNRFIFACGFCPQPGLTFVFVNDFPAVQQGDQDRRAVLFHRDALLSNAAIKKVFHYGCSDINALEEDGVTVQGYDWDTNVSEYLYYPDEHNKYGLANIAERRFQQFSGYKHIIFDDLFNAMPEDVKVPPAVRGGSYDSKETWLKAHGGFHLSRLRADTLRLYNGADCDLTKRIEIDNKKKVPHALVKLYMDLNFLLLRMEQNGPWFDDWQHRQVSRLWPYLEQKALAELREMVGRPDFNPGSPDQVYDVIYNQLGLIYPLRKGKPNTRKQTLMMLSRESPVPSAVLGWRRLSKALSTYIDGPKAVAERFGGRVKTVWWSTGTTSGRLSSSGGDEGGMNLQNLHKNKQLQNQYVADRRWRQVFNVIAKIKRTYHKDRWETEIECWVRQHMPDLKTFLILDYGQIEVRVAAQVSGDKNLIHDCAESDIHTRVGVTMTGWEADKIKHDNATRTLTKNVHFGILFGIEKHNLFDFIKAMNPDFDGTEEMVFEAYDRYFARYRGVARYIEQQRAQAQGLGYCETMFGLHRALNVTDKYADNDEDDDREFFDSSGERQTSWRNQCINCVDMGTEALTQRGWVRGTDLRPGDVLLTKNAVSGALEWQAATDIKVYPRHKSKLMQFKSRTFDSASTLDHRWLVNEKKGRVKRADVECRLTSEITQEMRIHRTGAYAAPAVSPYSDDFVRLAAWYLTDGSCCSGEGYSRSACMLFQSRVGNVAKVRMIDALMERLRKNEGLHYRTKSKALRRSEVVWHFAGDFGVRMRALFPERCLTPQFLTQLTKRQLHILLHTMVLGNGSGSELSTLKKLGRGKITFGTSRRATADAFQMLVSMNDLHASLAVRDFSVYNAGRKTYESMQNNPQSGAPYYVLTLCNRKFAAIYPQHKSFVQNVGVWCPMVPNTYFVARRNGHVFVTGNTPIQGTAHQLLVCGMVNLVRKPEEYTVLGAPSMDVHDALYMIVNVLELQEAYRKARYLLEEGSLSTVKSDFPHIDWKVPIRVAAEAGIRLGGRVDLEDDKFTVGGYLLDWYGVTKKQMLDLHQQLAEVPDAV